MRLEPDDLMKVALQMRSEVRSKYPERHFEKKYSNIKEEYPYLYRMIIDNSEHCMEILKIMITSLKNIQDGKCTREEMDKIIGYKLAKEFVFEKLDMTKEEIPEPEPIFIEDEEPEEPGSDYYAEDY